MKSDWYEPCKYCDPFIEWQEQKEKEAKRKITKIIIYNYLHSIPLYIIFYDFF